MIRRLGNFLMMVLVVGLMPITSSAIAGDHHHGPLKVEGAWIRATNVPVTAGYMSLTNIGKETVAIVGGTYDNAGRVELHTMKMKDGIAMMRQIKTLVIKPGATVRLAPGGYHLMLMNLKKVPLKSGDTATIWLIFRKGYKQKLIVPILQRAP